MQDETTITKTRTLPHLRWYIAGLLCLSSELNYLDRQTLSVLAVTIQRELGITDVEYSFITSSFLVSYTIMYAVSGRIVDVIGTRKSFLFFVSAWSIANMIHGFANTARQLATARFLLGAAEPANFTGGVKAISEWFPMRERALAVGIFNAGTAVGAAVAVPLVSFIALALDWRWAFVITGALGFIWVAVWAAVYTTPDRHPRLSDAERALILADAHEATVTTPVPIRQLLAIRATWGCVAARALIDPISYFLIFWIPKYLQEERGFTLAELGAVAWIPFVALAVGNISGGAIPRYLVSRGWSVNRARKTTMGVISCLLPVAYLMVTRVDSATAAIVFLTLLMFGHAAWGNITLPAEVFPARAVGTVSGLGGMFGGLAGVMTQMLIGYTIANMSFTPVFTACALMYLVAFALVTWLVGELGRVVPLERGPTLTTQ